MDHDPQNPKRRGRGAPGSVQDIITAAAGYLQKHGVESPRLNAELLLAHVLGKKRIDLYLEFDRPLGDRELDPCAC